MKKILILALCGLSWHQMERIQVHRTAVEKLQTQVQLQRNYFFFQKKLMGPPMMCAAPERIKNINPNEYSAFQARKKDLRMIVKEQ